MDKSSVKNGGKTSQKMWLCPFSFIISYTKDSVHLHFRMWTSQENMIHISKFYIMPVAIHCSLIFLVTLLKSFYSSFLLFSDLLYPVHPLRKWNLTIFWPLILPAQSHLYNMLSAFPLVMSGKFTLYRSQVKANSSGEDMAPVYSLTQRFCFWAKGTVPLNHKSSLFY